MWQLWSECRCDSEGYIYHLEYESEHIELLKFMKQFLSQKNRGMCYVIRHIKLDRDWETHLHSDHSCHIINIFF